MPATGCSAPNKLRRALLCRLILATASAMALPAMAAVCPFDRAALSYLGTPLQQAECLLQPIGPGGASLADHQDLPAVLTERIGTARDLPFKRLARYLVGQGLPATVIAPLAEPVSHARDNDPAAPTLRYFVIHDTSTPFLAEQPFPKDFDHRADFNDVSRYMGPDAVAHYFIDRLGLVQVGHDLAVPWRATKFESRVIGLDAKGLFMHVENVEPRRSAPDLEPGNDQIAPVPGLTPVQYDRLALLYIIASQRAGVWLVPAFHANVDRDLAAAHDDPQNFDLAAFARAVARHLRRLR